MQTITQPRRGRPLKPSGRVWEFFAEARSRSGLSRGALASQCGLNKTQIARYEYGTSAPKIEYINRLAAALSISPETLAVEATKFFGESER